MATSFLTPLNNAETTVANQLEIAGTALTVADGSVFPASNFNISLFVAKGVWNALTDEIAHCSSRTGDVLTIVRDQESTGDYQHLVGAFVQLNITAYAVSEIHSAFARTATLVVAASDADGESYKAADYRCDGTADDVQILAAIAALPAVGGIVQLTEGTFTIGASIALDSETTLQGHGMMTVIKVEDAHGSTINAVAANTKTGLKIRDLVIDGNQANQSSEANNGLLLTTCHYAEVSNVYVKNTAGTEAAIYLVGCNYAIVKNCTAIAGGDTTSGIYINNCDYCVIEGNLLKDAPDWGIESSMMEQCVLSNNVCEGNSRAIEVLGQRNVITNNQFCGSTNEGVYVAYTADQNLISNNFIYNNGLEGVRFIGLNNGNKITNNLLVSNGQTTDDTYAHIEIEGDSDNNLISGNVCRHGGGGDQASYGIDIQAGTCNENIIHGNDFHDSGKSGDINDSGTNTRQRNNIANDGTWLDGDVPNLLTDGDIVW